jgi:hypothetical protein
MVPGRAVQGREVCIGHFRDRRIDRLLEAGLGKERLEQPVHLKCGACDVGCSPDSPVQLTAPGWPREVKVSPRNGHGARGEKLIRRARYVVRVRGRDCQAYEPGCCETN